jgi:hypothetical protein
LGNERNKSFWHTLPGILTGTAAIITAITGLLVALISAGIIILPNSTNGVDNGTDQTTLITPNQISPAEDETFIGRSRFVEFMWGPVSGAVNYGIEIEYYSYGWHHMYEETIAETNYIYEFLVPETAEEKGRWRVWAINEIGLSSPKSTWWEFSFLR